MRDALRALVRNSLFPSGIRLTGDGGGNACGPFRGKGPHGREHADVAQGSRVREPQRGSAAVPAGSDRYVAGSRHIVHSVGPPPGRLNSSRTVKPKCS
ncbi:hypothetical protein GCM10017688_22210 [Streptomyces ramulosus]